MNQRKGRGQLDELDRPPGSGAVDFAKEIASYTDASEHELQRLFHTLIHFHTLPNEIHEQITDKKRIKQCAYCRMYYRDKTRPNNSRTCSAECKANRDVEKQRDRRRTERLKLENYDSRKMLEKYYYDWFEYPFYNEIEPHHYAKNYEILKEPAELGERINMNGEYLTKFKKFDDE